MKNVILSDKFDYCAKEQIDIDKVKMFDKENDYLSVYGSVPCGRKNMIDDNLRGYLKVPMKYFGDGEFYVLRAKGDSMIDAGIDDGDIVIIKKQNFAEDGKIAVVLIEDEITLKRIHLRSKENIVELLPANKKYKPIVPSDYSVLGIAQRIIKDINL